LEYVTIDDGFEFPYGYVMETHPELALKTLRQNELLSNEDKFNFLVNFDFEGKEKILESYNRD